MGLTLQRHLSNRNAAFQAAAHKKMEKPQIRSSVSLKETCCGPEGRAPIPEDHCNANECAQFLAHAAKRGKRG